MGCPTYVSDVIPAFMAAVRGGRPVEIHDDGRQTRDFIHVDTVVDVLTRAVQQRLLSPQPVNLGGPTTPLHP